MIDVYESFLYQFGGMGVIDFVAVCVTLTRSDVFLTSMLTSKNKHLIGLFLWL